jgi:hypothetical protein
MPLTAEIIKNLEGKSFNALYDQHEEKWRGMVTTAETYVRTCLPQGQDARPADVANILTSAVALDTHFRRHCENRKIHGDTG